MSVWEGVVLGLVQGLTEFLPVSSSGHLVLAGAALGLVTPGVVVEVALHVATLLAVVIVYRARLWELVRDAGSGKREAWMYVGLLALGSIPAGLVGLTLRGPIARAFDSLVVVGVNFLVTGAMLWSTRGRPAGAATEPSPRGAAAVGVAQALAILPGISRSGATVAAGLWLGIAPARAAEFSFLLAIPAIAGAGLLELRHLADGLETVGGGPLLVSFATALVAGVVAIRWLVTLLERGAFHRFAPYCGAVGLLTLAWGVFG